MQTTVVSLTRLFLLRLARVAAIFVLGGVQSPAEAPLKVAGSVYFDPTVKGQALTWPQGSIRYYTDQGDLSPMLSNASANALVASTLSQWTSIATAALSATAAGSLAEDVSGANVTRNSDGTIAIPPDIQATATGTPVAIIYDYDGAVTSALLGAGAGDASQCFSNAVFGGTDNYGSFADYQHALVVINGRCAQQSSQLIEIQYRLLRVLGAVLGVGWSQVNVNVQTGSPPATADDYAGFPLMHFFDLWNCVPVTLCYPNPTQLSMDDIAAISRLYPVTAQNQSSFPGKQIFSAATARVQGSVWFTDAHGSRTQAMQGVNVVARWIDPTTGTPSRRYAASSVSGFRFTGNKGNPITGTDDVLGEPLAKWGSDAQALEGFFDLAGLQVPNGGSAQYQLSVEALDSRWSSGVGPYSPGPVTPSGSFQPITVAVSAGSDVQQDILMTNTAQPLSGRSSSWTSPAPMASGGDWLTSFRYGNVNYFLLPIKTDRTLSIAATALDESGRSTQLKAQPVIGIWSANDREGTPSPAFTPSPFNSLVPATTRLDAQVLQAGNFLIGISDLRGDGRPDLRYHGHVLYADTVSPSRVGVGGGVVRVQGTGFSPGISANMNGAALSQLAITSSELILSLPGHSDGTQTMMITDPVTGGSTTMTNALTYGASAADSIVLIYAGNSQTPVGTQAAKPVMVRVLDGDGVTPVAGATVGWTTTNNLQLSACGGATSCSVLTDQNGSATTWLTPMAVGASDVIATLAPGVYSPAKFVRATVNAIQSSSDIAALSPNLWISQTATVTVPLTVRAVSNGVSRNGVQINFAIMLGLGNLSAASAQTNSNGYASVNLSLNQVSSETSVSACVAPGNAPCAIFYAIPVPLAQQQLQLVSGAGQLSTGQGFQPVVVRVVDSASPANPVIAAPVAFQTIIWRGGGIPQGQGEEQTNPINPAEPVILSTSQVTTTTDLNGLASVIPSRGSFSPPLQVDVLATAGTSALLDFANEVLPVVTAGNNSLQASPQRAFEPVKKPRWRKPEAR